MFCATAFYLDLCDLDSSWIQVTSLEKQQQQPNVSAINTTIDMVTVAVMVSLNSSRGSTTTITTSNTNTSIICLSTRNDLFGAKTLGLGLDFSAEPFLLLLLSN